MIVLKVLIAWMLLSVTLFGPFVLAPMIRTALRWLGLPVTPAARRITDHTSVPKASLSAKSLR